MPINSLIAQGIRPLGDELIGVQQTVNRNALANREMADRERDSGNYERQLDMQAESQRRNWAAQDQQGQAAQQEQLRNFLGVGLQNLEAVAQDPVQWGRVADQIAAHPFAQQLGITREQITPENVAALRVQAQQAPPEQEPQFAGSVEEQKLLLQGKQAETLERLRQQGQAAADARKPPPATGPSQADIARMRKEFRGLPSVKDYETALPLIKSAEKAPDTGYGDLQLIYTAGKVLDPGSVVREGELALTVAAGSPLQRAIGQTRFTLEKGGRLTPATRAQILDMLKQRVDAYGQAYDQDRSTYEEYAKGNGSDPSVVIGKHPLDAYGPRQPATAAPTGRRVKVDAQGNVIGN